MRCLKCRLENENAVGERNGGDYFWDGKFARYATNQELGHPLEAAVQLLGMSCFPPAEPGSFAACTTEDGGSRKWVRNPEIFRLRVHSRTD